MSKGDLEIAALRQEISHKNKQLWIAVLGVILGLSTLALERYSAYEQREFQIIKEEKARRIQRMNDIANAYETLLARTIAVLYESRMDGLFLSQGVERLTNDLEKSAEVRQLYPEFLSYLKEFKKSMFVDDNLEIRAFKEAAILQSSWEVKKQGFAPDMQYYFGLDAHNQSKKVAEIAWNALNEDFSIFSGGGSSDETLKEEGSVLAQKLRLAINAEYELTPK